MLVLLYVTLGAIFGVLLSRSGAADYNYIQSMFLLEDVQLYGIIGTAVVLTAPGLWMIRRRNPVFGHRLGAAFHRGHILGGLLFGVGWSMAGMCPGPIFVNIGEGKLYAVAALAGALTGAGLFGTAYSRLEPLIGLPPLIRGTGEG